MSWLDNAIAGIQDLVKYGSAGGKEFAMAEQERQKKAEDLATKKVKELSNEKMKEMEKQNKSLMEFYKKQKEDELHQLKVEKQRLSIMQQVQKMLGGEAQATEGKPTTTPTVAPTVAPTTAPTATPAPSRPKDPMEKFMIDYAPYIEDPAKIQKYYPKGIPQPPQELLDIIREVSPEDATRSAILKLTESSYNPMPKDYTQNNNGSIDRGTNMINSYTFGDMWNQEGMKSGTYPHRDSMVARGINTYEDMKDPSKNEQMMDLIRKVGGYGRWFGPRDKGFNILNQK